MSTKVTLYLPNHVYKEAKQVAEHTGKDVRQVLVDTLAQSIVAYPENENRRAMLHEIEAYKSLHSQLVENYLGQYAAIFQGQVIDVDPDPVALLNRIKQQYPDQVVLRRKVETQPEPVMHFRSPRFIHAK
jgi:hypothetical protein